MSTKMDEDDWAHTLAVFRACLPRRGRKAEDDRRFLEALHFFTVENVRWRGRPEQKGAGGASARALARRLHHENPRKIGRLRRHHRLRPDRGAKPPTGVT